jgi:hypothetical protein
MPSTIYLVGFTGSLREKSYNKAALRAAQELLPSHTELELLSLGDLPLYNEDLERDEPEAVRLFKERIHILDEPEVYIPFGWEKFDSDGHLTDKTTREQMRVLLEALVHLVQAPAYALAS